MDELPIGNLTLNENGAFCHVTTSKPFLDLFDNLVRTLACDKLKRLLDAVMAEHDITYNKMLFVLAFQTRNCRGGKGERDLFQWFLIELEKHFPNKSTPCFLSFPHYGYWKDVMKLLLKGEAQGTLREKLLELVKQQYEADCRALEHEDIEVKPSLLGKYLPLRKSGKQKTSPSMLGKESCKFISPRYGKRQGSTRASRE